MSWIHKSYYLDEIEDETFVKVFSSYLMRFQNIDKDLMEICNEFEEQYNLEQGSSIKYFKHLLARKLFFVDMSSQK
ncbi:TnsA endonuclease C-terminal domain-containing protein, partial [Bacillus cereus]|uniref:TnsA endonuclease C-terminal domain-containing protein n=1 Tax=Bacillus cereus TaxID=1396 RepID=UPI002480922A